MDYYIAANKKTNCDDFFPERLSNFLEQLPVADYNSEVRQVSEILHIKLDAFLILEPGHCDPDGYDYWQDINDFTAVVDGFIGKIAENQDYYKAVRYGKGADQLSDQVHELLRGTNENAASALLGQLYGNADLSFPADRGYLSGSGLLDDLNDLKRILNCYKAAGATKIKLTYG